MAMTICQSKTATLGRDCLQNGFQQGARAILFYIFHRLHEELECRTFVMKMTAVAQFQDDLRRLLGFQPLYSLS